MLIYIYLFYYVCWCSSCWCFCCFSSSLFSVGTVLCSTIPATTPAVEYELKLNPSHNEVVRFENESYIVSCHAGSNTRLRWLDPDNVWVDKKRGGVHVEQRKGGLFLVFASLSADTDNGTWTCQAEMDNQKTTFNMIVYSMHAKRNPMQKCAILMLFHNYLT